MIKASELRGKNPAELQQMLITKRAELIDKQTELRTSDVKNVRGLRVLKKDIARLRTVQSQQALAVEKT